MSTDHLFDVRVTAADERRLACDTMRAALLSGPISDDDWASAAPGWDDDEHWSTSAWSGDRCVAHAGYFRVDTVVPGGARLGTAAVTRIGVLPTARRHGLLSRMMRFMLTSARDEGRPLASLRASEAVIYGRFGFAIAADGVVATVDPRRARPIANAAPGTCRVLARDEILDVVSAIYDRVVARPGAITRSDYLWRRYLEDALQGDKASFVVVHTDPHGVDDGFAHYTVSWDERPMAESAGKGEVHDVWGSTAAVELALWSFLCDLDLVRTFRVDERPIDDVLRVAVRDPRAYQTTHRYDEQWVRLLDVERCLVSRTYRPGPPVTIAVTDPLFPDNDASYELDASGGVCRTDAPAELRCGVDALSAAYLGTVPWHDLAAAGRVQGDQDAVARADDRFAVRPLAFCGSFF